MSQRSTCPVIGKGKDQECHMGQSWLEAFEFSVNKSPTEGSNRKDKVSTGKGLYLHKGLDRSNTKAVSFEDPSHWLCTVLGDEGPCPAQPKNHPMEAREPQQGCPLLLGILALISIFEQVWHVLPWPSCFFSFSPTCCVYPTAFNPGVGCWYPLKTRVHKQWWGSVTNSLKIENGGKKGKHLLVVTLIKMTSPDILLLLKILPRQGNGFDMNRQACVNPFKLIWFSLFSAKGIRWLRTW